MADKRTLKPQFLLVIFEYVSARLLGFLALFEVYFLTFVSIKTDKKADIEDSEVIYVD